MKEKKQTILVTNKDTILKLADKLQNNNIKDEMDENNIIRFVPEFLNDKVNFKKYLLKINNIHIIVSTALIIVIRNILSLNTFKYGNR